MDSFEFNKIAGAVLATALGVMVLSIVSEIIFAPVEAEQPGLVVAGVEPGDGHGGGGAGAPPAEVIPIAVRLQTADVADGEDSAGKCKACHTFNEGDTRKTPGPNLWGVVGGPVAHLEGFGYSDAMTAKHDEGMTWTFENLDHFLTAPKAFIPGTAMTFAGLKRDDERADVIAYLRTLSNDPVPLPAVTAEAPAEAPADHAPAAEPAAPPAAAEPAAPPPPEPPAVQVPPDAPAVNPPAPPAGEPAPAEPAPH
jgi:cytochrome c